MRNESFLEKRKNIKKKKHEENMKMREKRERRLEFYLASIAFPIATFILGFLSFDATQDSSEKSLKLAIEHHNKSMAQTIIAMNAATEMHKENMEQVSKIHAQVLDANYKNLVHDQNRARYYETILLVSESLRALEDEFNFCNSFHVDIQKVYSENERIYSNSLFFLGDNYIHEWMDKNPKLAKETALDFAIWSLKNEHEMLIDNGLTFIEPNIKERVKNSKEFSNYLELRKGGTKFYEYIDREAEMDSFILFKLDEITQFVSSKEISKGEKVSEAKLGLEKEYSVILRKSKVIEKVYVNFKQLGGEFSVIADLLLFPDFNLHIKSHGISSAIEHYVEYEDSQFAHYKSTFPMYRSESEFLLSHYYDVLIWNLTLTESIFDYMREVNYEKHVANTEVFTDIFKRIERKLEAKNVGNQFVLHRCESAYQKAKTSIVRTLPFIEGIVNAKNFSNEKLLSSIFETLGHYAPSDFSEIETKLAERNLGGPDSIREDTKL